MVQLINAIIIMIHLPLVFRIVAAQQWNCSFLSINHYYLKQKNVAG